MRGTFFLYKLEMIYIFPAAFRQRHFKRGNEMKYVLALVVGLSLSLSFIACDKDDKGEAQQVVDVTDTTDTGSQDVSDTSDSTEVGDTGSVEDTGSADDTGTTEDVADPAEDTGSDTGE